MPTFRRFSVLLSLAVASLLFTVALPVAQGQTLASTASFSGSVSDSTGARLPNAKDVQARRDHAGSWAVGQPEHRSDDRIRRADRGIVDRPPPPGGQRQHRL